MPAWAGGAPPEPVEFLDEVVPVAEESRHPPRHPSRRSADSRCSACRASSRPRPTPARCSTPMTARQRPDLLRRLLRLARRQRPRRHDPRPSRRASISSISATSPSRRRSVFHEAEHLAGGSDMVAICRRGARRGEAAGRRGKAGPTRHPDAPRPRPPARRRPGAERQPRLFLCRPAEGPRRAPRRHPRRRCADRVGSVAGLSKRRAERPALHRSKETR